MKKTKEELEFGKFSALLRNNLYQNPLWEEIKEKVAAYSKRTCRSKSNTLLYLIYKGLKVVEKMEEEFEKETEEYGCIRRTDGTGE